MQIGAPLPLEYLFDANIDVREPFDRTKRLEQPLGIGAMLRHFERAARNRQ